MSTENVVAAPEIASDVLKVPPFIPRKPHLWFVQLEAQFSIAGITADLTKFCYAVSSLDPKYAEEMVDVIMNPPANDKYAEFKEKLCDRFSKLECSKMKQLLETVEMGDRSPSQFLRHMKSLANATIPDEFVREMWISRLPANIQDILATQDEETDVEIVAKLADKVFENMLQRKIAAVEVNPQIDELKKQINELETLMQKQISELKTLIGQSQANLRFS